MTANGCIAMKFCPYVNVAREQTILTKAIHRFFQLEVQFCGFEGNSEAFSC